MVVGVPGTGIGGLFYLLAALCMPLHELVQVAKGRSSLARWRFIAMQWTMIAGMLASLWGAMWLFKAGAAWLGIDESAGLLAVSPTGAELMRETNVFLANAALGSFISLTVIMLAVQALRICFPLSALRRAEEIDAPAAPAIWKPMLRITA